MSFQTPVDIANRACQHVGVRRIVTLFPTPEATNQAQEIAACYNQLRIAELTENLWKFATRRVVLRPIDVNTMLLVPAAWSSTSKYIMGSVVSYGGLIYTCQGWQVIGTSPDVDTINWAPYFGPMTVEPYDTSGATTYFTGELIYTPSNEGVVVYLAINTPGTDVPGVFPVWNGTGPYNRGQSVFTGLVQVLSEPGDIPVFSNPGDIPVVSVPAGGPQQSLFDLNTTVPGSNPAQWQGVPAIGQPDYMTGLNWLRLDATVQSITVPYPYTAGPASDPTTLNAYYLPNGWLRHAPDDPKRGLIAGLGAPTNPPPSDLVFENVFALTGMLVGLTNPLMLRFVADMTSVPLMNALFCEGWAARIAREVCERITQSTAKHEQIDRDYTKAIDLAKAIDAIERGITMPPLDGYLLCRA